MARIVPKKKAKAAANRKAAPAPAARPKIVKPKKGKIPTLGGSITGLGGTGASGMMP
jgi:hypothetical protein